MPTYEYLCKTCGHRFETWQKMTDEPLTTCPNCGAEIRRVLFPAGVVFKGSGFYKTDHRDSVSAAASAGENGKTETAQTTSDGNTSTSSTPAESDSKAASESKSTAPTSAA